MSVYFESRTNKRKVNQDRYLYMEYRVNHEALVKTFLIADGMGGLTKGEKASALAVEKWSIKLQKLIMSDEFVEQPLLTQTERLKQFSYRAVQEINEEVYREFQDEGIEAGTTLTTGILFWDTLILSNCGDSPAYLYRKKDESIIKLSKDQNVAEELVRQNEITRDSAVYSQKKHMLTDYIGKYRKACPNVMSLEYQKGDLLLMGSDGAFGMLTEEELGRVIRERVAHPDQIIDAVFLDASEMGEEDNQTMILYTEKEEKKEEKKPSGRFGFFRSRQAV